MAKYIIDGSKPLVWNKRRSDFNNCTAPEFVSNLPDGRIIYRYCWSGNVWLAFSTTGVFLTKKDAEQSSPILNKEQAPREWWVNRYEDGRFGSLFDEEEDARKVGEVKKALECIRVREILNESDN